MIIRHKLRGNYAIVPNAIFHDERLSLEAKALLGYLLSLPENWEVRHAQLQRKLRIGRKLLERCFRELIASGYVERDERQGRDGLNRFTTLNYVVRNVPDRAAPDAPEPLRKEPQRPKRSGNNKEEIKTDLNNPFSKSLPAEIGESKAGRQVIYSETGQRALMAGNQPVYVGSKPYQAWLSVRGADGMPGFIDRALINGRVQEIVWMPSVYPPRRKGSETEDREW